MVKEFKPNQLGNHGEIEDPEVSLGKIAPSTKQTGMSLKSKRRGGSPWCSDILPWKKVSLDEKLDNDAGGKKKKPPMSYNHYDAEFLERGGKGLNAASEIRADDNKRKADSDDGFAMLFGFEVLEAGSYQLTTKVDSQGGAIKSVVPIQTSQDVEGKSQIGIHHPNKNMKEQKQIEGKKRKRKRKKGPGTLNSGEGVSQELKVVKTGKYETTEADMEQKKAGWEDEQVNTIQSQWNAACGYGPVLHPLLCYGLHKMGFGHPTPIQAATLSAAILGRRNIVGAAPTGSGKTLSYALPILHHILSHRVKPEIIPSSTFLQGLVICPTRELALQVQKEISSLSCQFVKCIILVGGMSMHKQHRLLTNKPFPEIIVATPGRLWELISTGGYDAFEDFRNLRFLVLDEADRMIGPGNFPQLKSILRCIRESGRRDTTELSTGSELKKDVLEDQFQSTDLEGIPGEAKVEFLTSDILDRISQPKVQTEPNEVDNVEMSLLHEENHDGTDCQIFKPRQTFVYSATLTLPTITENLRQKKPKNGKKRLNEPNTCKGTIDFILALAGATGQTKVVDLTSSDSSINSITKENLALNSSANTSSLEVRTSKNVSHSNLMPSGLSICEIKCALKQKDTQCYAYLTTTKQGTSGPSLVFCNSIECVRRVTETLRLLRVPVSALHAQMPQKSRFKALETLRQGNSRAVVVATDVAARGLDIPAVSSVIHYDIARSVDTYIHRAGRTARGVGKSATGTSVSLVAPADDARHNKICKTICGHTSQGFHTIVIDGRMISEAHRRASLAAKIVEWEDAQSKKAKKRSWFMNAAEEAGLDLDEDDLSLENGEADSNLNQCRRSEVKQAKEHLRVLLSMPMKKQHFGKFLSGPGIRESLEFDKDMVPQTIK